MKEYIPVLLFIPVVVIAIVLSPILFAGSEPVEKPQKHLIATYNLGYSEIPGTHNLTVKIEYTKTEEFTTLYTGKIGEYNRDTMEYTQYPPVPVFWFETENFDMIRNKIRNDLR